jgi:hypothetical protein
MEEIKIEVTDEQILEYFKKGYKDEKNGSSTIEPDDKVLRMAYSQGAFHKYVENQDPIYDDGHTNYEKVVRLIKEEYISEQEGIRAWMEHEKQEAEEYKRIMETIKEEKGVDWYNELIETLEEEDCYFSPEIVDKPKGEKQELYGDLIKEEWVNQTTNGGYTGDDFAGTIYFKLSEGRYLELQYSM